MSVKVKPLRPLDDVLGRADLDALWRVSSADPREVWTAYYDPKDDVRVGRAGSAEAAARIVADHNAGLVRGTRPATASSVPPSSEPRLRGARGRR